MNSREVRLLVGGGAANCVASGMWWVQPILMQQFVSRAGMSESAAGLILTAEILSLSLVSTWLAKKFAPDRDLRVVALFGALLEILATVATVVLPPLYWFILLSRALAGVGCAMVLVASNRLGAQSVDPDSMYARYGFLNVLSGVALMAAMGPLSRLAGGNAAFVALALLAAIGMPALLAIPKSVDQVSFGSAGTEMLPSRILRRIVVLAAATFLIGLSSGIIWAFYGLIGEAAGMKLGEVENALGLAIMAAGASTALASWMGTRFGRVAPLTIAMGALVMSILVLSHKPDAMAFTAAAAVNLAVIYFLLPYLLGAGAAEDAHRGPSYVAGAFFLSGAASPLLGGYLVEAVGINTVGNCVAVVLVAVSVVIAGLERTARALKAKLA